jgi:2-polyprenyl-6-methoxyphenol hydroxylase-like FAD-dependent oxidoreductase
VQGSQIAIESAVILARLLAEQEPSDQLFNRYAELRKPRTDAVVEAGRRIIGYSFKSGWRNTVRDFFVRILGGYFLRSGGLGQYDYDAGTAPL